MNALYRPFKSIEDIKSRGEFIHKGKIYPARIIKAEKRKYQRLIKSGSNQWAFPTPGGYVLFIENNDDDFFCVIRIDGTKIFPVKCSPYSSGVVHFQGNVNLDKDQSLSIFNKVFLSKCLVPNGVRDNTKQLQINMDYSATLINAPMGAQIRN